MNRSVFTNRPQREEAWSCLRRFLTVGLLGTMLDITLFAVARGLLGLPTLLANTLSYSAGMVNNYVLHRRWTFQHRVHKSVSAEFTQFLLVNVVALILNNAMVLVLAHPASLLWPRTGLGILVAKIAATGVSMAWNFIANNFWTFRNRPVASLVTIRDR